MPSGSRSRTSRNCSVPDYLFTAVFGDGGPRRTKLEDVMNTDSTVPVLTLFVSLIIIRSLREALAIAFRQRRELSVAGTEKETRTTASAQTMARYREM